MLRPRGPHDMLPSFDRLKETNTTFSEYFDDITFNLDELITRFEVITQKSTSLSNARYFSNEKKLIIISTNI